MKVKNLNGTSANACKKCGSRLAHWEKLSGKTAKTCCCKGCANDAKVGAHVQKDTTDMSWYIIPLCHACNKKPSTEVFELNTGSTLESAVACS